MSFNSYGRGRFPRKRSSKIEKIDTYSRVVVTLPTKVFAQLKALSIARELPVSRLIGYAIDNEFDFDPPFNYPCALPTTPYKAFEYAEEAAKILKFLITETASGLGYDMILLLRRSIGIPDRERTLHGIRELLEQGMIEEFYPGWSKFVYGRDYRYVKPKRDVLELQKSERKKKIRRLAEVTGSDEGPLNDESED